MAARNSTGASRAKQADKVPTDLPQGLDVGDVRRAIEPVIEAFFKIWRLADRTGDELDERNVDGRIFLNYITQLSVRHGKALDDLYMQLSGGTTRVGYFSTLAEADYESPLPVRKEAANG